MIWTYCPFEFVGPTFPLLVESLLGPRWADAYGGPSRTVARKAWHEARVARFFGWRYPNYGPHARASAAEPRTLRERPRRRPLLRAGDRGRRKHGGRYDLAAPLDASRAIPESFDLTGDAASNCSTSSEPLSRKQNGYPRKTLKGTIMAPYGSIRILDPSHLLPPDADGTIRVAPHPAYENAVLALLHSIVGSHVGRVVINAIARKHGWDSMLIVPHGRGDHENKAIMLDSQGGRHKGEVDHWTDNNNKRHHVNGTGAGNSRGHPFFAT